MTNGRPEALLKWQGAGKTVSTLYFKSSSRRHQLGWW